MNESLTERLQKAARGHTAIAGSDAPNIFAEALAELERLSKIESMVKQLLWTKPQEGGDNHLYSRITKEEVEKRFELGRKLGEAVGVFPRLKA